MPEGSEAADEIERRAPAISRRVIAEMYRDDPFWHARFGDRGRRHADEDGDFHVRYLVEALRAGSPAVFVSYARWLRTLLTSRGMCTRHVAENFTRLADALVAEGLAGAPAAADVLTAAIASLRHDDADARRVQEDALELAARTVALLRERHADWYAGAPERWDRRLDDVLYHLSYLADALAAGKPELFTAHATFAATSVGPTVPVAHVRATLEVLGGTLEARGGPARALAMLRAGVAALLVETVGDG